MIGGRLSKKGTMLMNDLVRKPTGGWIFGSFLALLVAGALSIQSRTEAQDLKIDPKVFDLKFVHKTDPADKLLGPPNQIITKTRRMAGIDAKHIKSNERKAIP